MVDRRRFLSRAGTGAAGLGAAAFLAACGDKAPKKAKTPPLSTLYGEERVPEPRGTSDSRDVRIINRALAREYRSIAAYELIIPLVSGTAREAAESFAEQEREHASALVNAMRAYGGEPERAKPTYDFPGVVDEKTALALAQQIEDDAITGYLESLPNVKSPDLRGTFAAIMSTEAEHLSVVLGEQGANQSPKAFVTGSAS